MRNHEKGSSVECTETTHERKDEYNNSNAMPLLFFSCFSFPNSDFLALTALNFSLTISK